MQGAGTVLIRVTMGGANAVTVAASAEHRVTVKLPGVDHPGHWFKPTGKSYFSNPR